MKKVIVMAVMVAMIFANIGCMASADFNVKELTANVKDTVVSAKEEVCEVTNIVCDGATGFWNFTKAVCGDYWGWVTHCTSYDEDINCFSDWWHYEQYCFLDYPVVTE